jgi:hypothetical protein
MLSLGFSAYLLIGFYVWLTSALSLIGAAADSYMGKIKRFSDQGKIQEVLSLVYMWGLWPIHLIMGWSLKK